MRELCITAALSIIGFLIICYAVRAMWAIMTSPKLLAGIAAALLLIVFLFDSAHATTFELSVITESADDRAAADEAVSAAAAIYRTQLGVELVATVHEVSTVAGHTKAEALLDAVKQFRLDRPALRATDATVLFTRRDMTRGSEGIATTGPSCSAAASLIVRLRNDGLDGEILAHEIAHTVGVPHDAMPGYLMSESVARSSAPNFSPDSVLTFKAAPADCMESLKAQAASTTPSATATGGGGASDVWTLGGLLLTLGIVSFVRATQITERRFKAQIADLEMKLASATPSKFMFADVLATQIGPEGLSRHLLLVEFATYGCMLEFQQWILYKVNAARKG